MILSKKLNKNFCFIFTNGKISDIMSIYLMLSIEDKIIGGNKNGICYS